MFHFSHQTNFYKGKVRDVYTIADKYLVMHTSNRISAFDVVLPREIPYKGQVLNQIAHHFLTATKDIVPNWLLDASLPNIAIGLRCTAYPVEMVVRGYLAGHAAREYKLGKRKICGVSLPDGLQENDKLPFPIITPTTKAAIGHDMDISKEEILNSNLVSKTEYEQLEAYTLALYERGVAMADKQNLILVDTKYEFGKLDNTIYLIDEIHTPDSSRYFYKDSYQELQEKQQAQKQLSKEFVRQWLIDNGFQGKEHQVVPAMTDEWIQAISNRYIELYEHITGSTFIKGTTLEDTVLQDKINNILAQYV